MCVETEGGKVPRAVGGEGMERGGGEEEGKTIIMPERGRGMKERRDGVRVRGRE